MIPLRLFPLITRRVVRNRGRSILTASGAGVAIFVFLMLGALVARLTAPLAHAQDSKVLAVRQDGRGLVLASRLPQVYEERIAAIEGVARAAAVFEEIVVQDRVHIWVRGIGPDAYASIYDIKTNPGQVWPSFADNRGAALAGHRVMLAMGWSVGSQIALTSLGVDVQIVGELPDQDGDFADHVLVHQPLLQSARGVDGQVSYILVAPSPDVDATVLRDRIDRTFETKAVKTHTESSQAFAAALVDDFSGFVAYLRLMSWLALVVCMLAVANAIALSVRDRERELATMKAIGYPAATVLQLVLGESILLTVTGGVFGVALASLLLKTVASSVLIFHPIDALIAVGITAFMGLVGGLVPALEAARTPIAVALKGAN